jgi:uncharacterized protein YfdQ (DUF2303 family)
METNIATSIFDAARAATPLISVADSKDDQFLIVPDGYKAQDLIHLKAQPRRITETKHFDRMESFCRYVNVFKDDTTFIRLNQVNGSVSAILDYHAVDGPSWCSHQAGFSPVLTEEWKRWKQKDGQSLSQKDLAEFLEDNAPDIVNPSSAELLDVARSLTAKLNVNFKRAVVLEDDTVQLTYEETIDAKAGVKGSLEIPSEFTISVAVFAGSSPEPLNIRLRYSIKEGQLTFKMVLVRPHKHVEREIDNIAATIKATCDIQPFYGS